VIPSYTSIDLELRLSNSDATSLLCDRNRLRLRQLPFCAPPPFRWQPFTLQRRADKVNPKCWSSLHKLRETTTKKTRPLIPQRSRSNKTVSTAGRGVCHVVAHSATPHAKSKEPELIADAQGAQVNAPIKQKKRPLRAAAAVRCFQHRGGPGRQPGSIQKRTRVRSMQR